MTKLEQIEQNLSIIPKTTLVEVYDESNNHKHGNNSHFRVFIVSEHFKNMNTVERHRTVYNYLNKISYHALGISAMSNQEYQDGKLKNTSPDCKKNA